MTSREQELVEAVTQEDRDAAANLVRILDGPVNYRGYVIGVFDQSHEVQAFKNHRLAAIAAYRTALEDRSAGA